MQSMEPNRTIKKLGNTSDFSAQYIGAFSFLLSPFFSKQIQQSALKNRLAKIDIFQNKQQKRSSKEKQKNYALSCKVEQINLFTSVTALIDTSSMSSDGSLVVKC
jgi:hypothetical protein